MPAQLRMEEEEGEEEEQKVVKRTVMTQEWLNSSSLCVSDKYVAT